jgi:phosphatidylinositol glycan class A protein
MVYGKEKVYSKIVNEPNPSMLERVRRCYSNGPVVGVYMLILMIFNLFFLRILEFFRPSNTIEPAITFPCQEYKSNKERYGDHSTSVGK